jgi:DNA-dependent RNA polymerase auxiliary subunit epsilon
MGTANYNHILQNMTQMVLDISENWSPVSSGGSMGGSANVNNLKQQLVAYRQMLTDLRSMRKINEKLFMELAKLFKTLKGKNYLNIFYQKEYRLTPDRETMESLRANRNIRFDVIEVFDEEHSDEFMDVEKVSQALKASSVTVNFFYVQKQAIRRTGLQSKEFSGDVYNVLSKIARATGGVVIATSKPVAALKKTFGGK